MGGNSGQQGLSNTAGGLSGVAQSELPMSLANQNMFSQLMQGPTAFYSGLTSGNPADLQTALAPDLARIDQAMQAQKTSILNSMPPGAARDYALQQLTMGTNSQKANLSATARQGAFGQLVGLANNYAQTGLQQAGAGINADTSASNAYGNLAKIQAAQKASTMNFLGSLVGGAATLGSGALIGSGISSLAGAAGGGGIPLGPISVNSPGAFLNPGFQDASGVFNVT